MVVMRRFLFLNDDAPPMKSPSFRIEKESIKENVSSNGLTNENTLTTVTNKSSRRVTLFEGKK